MTYRVGNHHGVTIVREPDQQAVCCNREDHDCTRGHLVAVVVNGDQALAERICDLLNADERSAAHADDCNCGDTYTDPWCAPRKPPTLPDDSPEAQSARAKPVALMIARPGLTGWTGCDLPGHHGCDPWNCRWAPDSCTCPATVVSTNQPDPDCPVHHGRRARGPKPSPVGPGCICDGSGRTCRRHGAVI